MTRMVPSVAQSSVRTPVEAQVQTPLRNAAEHGGSSDISVSKGWPALIVAGAVFGAAMYSFSPRPLPYFPDTRLHADSLLMTGLATTGQHYVGVGEQGHVLIADAPQGPWRDARVQPQRGSALTQVRALDGGLLLAVGHDGWIVRSTDGGMNWKEAAFDDNVDSAAPLLGIGGPYNGKLYAYGAFGQLLISTDQGASWQKQSSETLGDRHFYGMTQAADGALWLVGEQGTLLRSGDDGATWAAQPQIYAGSFFGALTLPDRTMLLYGMRGKVFRSGDAGKHWEAVPMPAEVSLFGGALDAEGHAVLAGAGNTVYVSHDNGHSFTQVTTGNRHDLAAVLPLADGRLLTAGDGGITLDRAGAAK